MASPAKEKGGALPVKYHLLAGAKGDKGGSSRPFLWGGRTVDERPVMRRREDMFLHYCFDVLIERVTVTLLKWCLCQAGAMQTFQFYPNSGA